MGRRGHKVLLLLPLPPRACHSAGGEKKSSGGGKLRTKVSHDEVMEKKNRPDEGAQRVTKGTRRRLASEGCAATRWGRCAKNQGEQVQVAAERRRGGSGGRYKTPARSGAVPSHSHRLPTRTDATPALGAWEATRCAYPRVPSVPYGPPSYSQHCTSSSSLRRARALERNPATTYSTSVPMQL